MQQKKSEIQKNHYNLSNLKNNGHQLVRPSRVTLNPSNSSALLDSTDRTAPSSLSIRAAHRKAAQSLYNKK
jgi:hypothetical protein